MNIIKNTKKNGISLRMTVLIMFIVSVVLTAFLLFTAFQTIKSFERLSIATDNYIELQDAADSLMKASDYLTDEAQCYTVLGGKETSQ